MLNISQLSQVNMSNASHFGTTFYRRNEPGFNCNNISCLLDENPELATGGNLYSEFLVELQQHSLDNQVLDLVKGFYGRLSKALDILETIDKTTNNFGSIGDLDINLKGFISLERHTWTLILSLYQDRFDSELRAEDSSQQNVDVADVNYSEKKLIQLLFERDTELREAQLVADWLEGIARENLERNSQSEAQFVSELILWTDLIVNSELKIPHNRMWTPIKPINISESTTHSKFRQGHLPTIAEQTTKILLYNVDCDYCRENTNHCLQYQSKEYCRQRNIVPYLYPDAPIKGKGTLLDDDREEEERFLRYLFVLIRSGQLDKAQKHCISTGQAWRAAELEGWRLYHDQGLLRPGQTRTSVTHNAEQTNVMMDEDEQEELEEEIEGNPNRILFKAVNWRGSKNERLSLTERCIFAVYSGNLDTLLHLCKSDEDVLWAHLKVMIESRVDAKVRTLTDRGVLNSQCIMGPLSDDGSDDIPDAAWIPGEWDLGDLFLQVEAALASRGSHRFSHFNTTFRSKSSKIFDANLDDAETMTQMFRRIQKAIVLRDVEGLVRDINGIVENISSNNYYFKQTLRFLAHIVLFLRHIHVDLDESKSVAVLEAYVKALIDNDDCDLIASYVSNLHPSTQNFWYARYLEGVVDKEKRLRTINLGKAAGLNIPRIVSLVVTGIRQTRNSDIEENNLNQWNPIFDNDEVEAMGHTELTGVDLRKIDALDWLIIVPNQLTEALRQCNALCRHFIIYDKIQGAKQAIEKLPGETLDKIVRHIEQSSRHAPNWLLNAQREHECLLLFLEAREAFNDWYTHFTRNRPHVPAMMETDSRAAGLSIRETIYRENRIKDYEAEFNKWKHVLELHCNSVSAKIHSVLESSYPGFLIDEYSWDNVDTSLLSEQDLSVYQEEESRQKELQLLKQYCIRDLTFLLVRVLKSVGKYQQVMRVADIIASEEYKHYQVFQSHQMQQLLSHFREASLSLLDENLDPLGYSTS